LSPRSCVQVVPEPMQGSLSWYESQGWEAATVLRVGID
jgi:hypothetical protein